MLQVLTKKLIQSLRSHSVAQREVLHILAAASRIRYTTAGKLLWSKLMRFFYTNPPKASPQLSTVTLGMPAVALRSYGLTVWPVVAASCDFSFVAQCKKTKIKTNSISLQHSARNNRFTPEVSQPKIFTTAHDALFLLRLWNLLEDVNSTSKMSESNGKASLVLAKEELKYIIWGYMPKILQLSNIPASIRFRLLQALLKAGVFSPRTADMTFLKSLETSLSTAHPIELHNLLTSERSQVSPFRLTDLLLRTRDMNVWSIELLAKMVYQLLLVERADAKAFDSRTWAVLKFCLSDAERRLSNLQSILGFDVIAHRQKQMNPMKLSKANLYQCVSNIQGNLSKADAGSEYATVFTSSSPPNSSTSGTNDAFEQLVIAASPCHMYPSDSALARLWDSVTTLDSANFTFTQTLLLRSVKQNCRIARRLAQLATLSSGASRYLKIQRGGQRTQPVLPPILGHLVRSGFNTQLKITSGYTYASPTFFTLLPSDRLLDITFKRPK